MRKQVQTRYFRAAILASVFFIVIYLLVKFDLLISILLTVLIYIGGILLFKPKDIRQFSEEYVNGYYYLGSKIQNVANHSENDSIKESATKITEFTDKILNSLSQRPNKVEQAFDFFDYYLDIAYKIIYKYNYIYKKEDQTKEEKKYIKDTPTFLKDIETAFEKQYKNMQESRILDIDAEIKLFESGSGINKENIEVGENNED
ncbi:MAG: 5-bromo-4-chloroindolyl phosphate hydrolysis family protein [Bacilli bacterium]|nr:5-bromo-4-chloroindolyl phosphate hydrolysis family protein [Bacilli bacterium]